MEGHACDKMAALRVFVLESISARTVAMGGSLSENTLAIGIGEDVQQIDDVKCLTHLWRAALGAGHGLTSASGWAFAGHTLVRPCVVTSMGDILTNGRRRATRSDAKNVTERVVRRHGVSAVGDRLNLGAIFPRSASYAGTAIMGRHLRRWKRVESMSVELVAAVGAGTTLSDLADKIAAHDLDGMRAGTGYWCLHWARLFTEDFAGMKVPGLAVTVDGPCMRRLLEMGDGVMALTLLGINRENVAEELPRLCVVMTALAARLQCPRVVRLAQAVVAACEAHRRGALARRSGGLMRRAGL